MPTHIDVDVHMYKYVHVYIFVYLDFFDFSTSLTSRWWVSKGVWQIFILIYKYLHTCLICIYLPIYVSMYDKPRSTSSRWFSKGIWQIYIYSRVHIYIHILYGYVYLHVCTNMNLSTNTCIDVSQAQLDKQQVVLKRKMDESNSDKIRLKTLLQKKENVAGVKAATAAKVCMCVCMYIHLYIIYVYTYTRV